LVTNRHANSFKDGTTSSYTTTPSIVPDDEFLYPPPPAKMRMIGNFLLKLALTLTSSPFFSAQGVLAAPQGSPAPGTLTALNAAAQLDTATHSGLLYDVAVIGGGSSGV
jgi:hypothetical protein